MTFADEPIRAVRVPRQVDPAQEPARLLVDFHREGDEWRYFLYADGVEGRAANGGSGTSTGSRPTCAATTH